jgi:hypothetical protein
MMKFISIQKIVGFVVTACSVVTLCSASTQKVSRIQRIIIPLEHEEHHDDWKKDDKPAGFFWKQFE